MLKETDDADEQYAPMAHLFGTVDTAMDLFWLMKVQSKMTIIFKPMNYFTEVTVNLNERPFTKCFIWSEHGAEYWVDAVCIHVANLGFKAKHVDHICSTDLYVEVDFTK